jgi:hypothetical protein
MSRNRRPPKKVSAKAKQKAKARKPAKRKRLDKPIRDRSRAARISSNEAAPTLRTRGLRSAGQSGDTEGLSDAPGVDSESVAELVEEGQGFEAELVDAIEHAPDPDQAELDAELPAENDADPGRRSFLNRKRL